jgi:hypothetical protein
VDSTAFYRVGQRAAEIVGQETSFSFNGWELGVEQPKVGADD